VSENASFIIYQDLLILEIIKDNKGGAKLCSGGYILHHESSKQVHHTMGVFSEESYVL
jgi:hypothetical protein